MYFALLQIVIKKRKIGVTCYLLSVMQILLLVSDQKQPLPRARLKSWTLSQSTVACTGLVHLDHSSEGYLVDRNHETDRMAARIDLVYVELADYTPASPVVTLHVDPQHRRMDFSGRRIESVGRLNDCND